MKLTLTIAAVMLATAAGAERLDTSGFYNGGGFDHAPDAYTPSNPSPGRGGTYDGDDGYTQPRGLGWSAPATPPANFRNFARDLFRGCKWCK